MFIRETVKTVKGKKYTQHQLIESVRTPAGPRQRLLLNLGSLQLNKDKWKDLANAIEDELHNQPSLFVADAEIANLAQHYARVIVREKLNTESEKNTEKEPLAEKEIPRYESVDIHSLSTSEARSIGVEHVILNQMQEYRLDQILKWLKFDQKQRDYAKMLIVGRLAHPASERETVRWVNENSAIKELLGSEAKVYDNALHRSAIMLWENHSIIEQELSESARKRFSLEEKVILYDLTNTFFESSKKFSQIAKIGKSKEKQHSQPLVTLALTVDEDGFAKQSRILEGNISEPATLERVLDELSDYPLGFNSHKTIVIDAGIATEDNIDKIKARGFNYVAVSRKRSYEEDFWKESEKKPIKLSDGKTTLTLKSVKTDEEIYLLCHSEAKAAKEAAILERKLGKFEEELKAINVGLSRSRTQKGYDKINQRIGRLKEKYKVGNLYDIEVKQKEGVTTSIDFRKNPHGKAAKERIGEYVLRTNRIDLGEEAISKIHRSLTTIEDSFRSMKSELGLRPNYHQRDDTCIAHIFITVIAYHILAGVLKTLRNNGINYRWNSIRNILSSQVRVTTTFNTENQDTIHIRTTTAPTAKQQDICSNLKIKQRPLKSVKITIPLKKNKVERQLNKV